MEHMEIERKWRMAALPEGISALPHTEIEQGYLCRKPVVRVRRDGEEYYLTYKSAGFMIREEYNLPLTAEAYAHLIGKADGRLIQKTRYRKRLSALEEMAANDMGRGGSEKKVSAENMRALIVEIDVFHGELSGLLLLEVEFDSEEAARGFMAPDWFGTEVTGNPAYSNAALSEAGLPR